MTKNVARPRTTKPQHRRGDLLRSTRATDGNVLRDLGISLLVPVDDIMGDLRVDQAGIHCVHPDALLDVFQSCRPRQADHAVLGRDVRADPGLPVNAPTGCITS